MTDIRNSSHDPWWKPPGQHALGHIVGGLFLAGFMLVFNLLSANSTGGEAPKIGDCAPSAHFAAWWTELKIK